MALERTATANQLSPQESSTVPCVDISFKPSCGEDLGTLKVFEPGIVRVGCQYGTITVFVAHLPFPLRSLGLPRHAKESSGERAYHHTGWDIPTFDSPDKSVSVVEGRL